MAGLWASRRVVPAALQPLRAQVFQHIELIPCAVNIADQPEIL